MNNISRKLVSANYLRAAPYLILIAGTISFVSKPSRKFSKGIYSGMNLSFSEEIIQSSTNLKEPDMEIPEELEESEEEKTYWKGFLAHIDFIFRSYTKAFITYLSFIEKRSCTFCSMFLDSPCSTQFKFWSRCIDKAKEGDRN